MMSIPPTYHVRKLSTPLQIDGDTRKAAWDHAEAAWLAPVTGGAATVLDAATWERARAGSLQDAPVSGDTGSLRYPTLFRALWSDTALYLAFECLDPDIWGTWFMRDEPLYDEEVVEAFLSPTGDLHRYYEFQVSPHNVVFDATVANPDLDRRTMTVDTTWDCPGLRTAVRIVGEAHRTTPEARHATGAPGFWSAEVVIPFAAFPEAGAPAPGDTWRGNFYRIERFGEPEYSAWSPTLKVPADYHVPPRFGTIVFERE